jgi:hypothetical protein
MLPMEAATQMKEEALGMGARAVGIASVEAINRFAPPGHRPSVKSLPVWD